MKQSEREKYNTGGRSFLLTYSPTDSPDSRVFFDVSSVPLNIFVDSTFFFFFRIICTYIYIYTHFHLHTFSTAGPLLISRAFFHYRRKKKIAFKKNHLISYNRSEKKNFFDNKILYIQKRDLSYFSHHSRYRRWKV